MAKKTGRPKASDSERLMVITARVPPLMKLKILEISLRERTRPSSMVKHLLQLGLEVQEGKTL